MHNLPLLPLNDLQPVLDDHDGMPSTGGIRRWRMLGEDPHFLVQPLPKDLSGGIYEIRLELSEGSTLSEPRIYVDDGDGFNEEQSIVLTPDGDGTSFRARFLLEVAPVQMRFDPSVAPGTFALTGLSLRPLSKREATLAAKQLSSKKARVGRLARRTPLNFKPEHQLLFRESVGDTRIWEMTGNDPYFLTGDDFPKVGPGLYELRIELGSDVALSSPKLYLNTGQGFHETQAVRLQRDRSGLVISSIFGTRERIVGLRFDPSIQMGLFPLRRITLRRLSTTAWRLRRVSRAGRAHLRNPSDLMYAVRRSATLLREGGWPALRQVIARAAARIEAGSGSNYLLWTKLYDLLTDEDLDELRLAAETLPQKPLISVLMPVYNTPPELLSEAIDSVLAQVYPHWELCIADDASPAPHVREVLERYRSRDRRIKVVYRETNGHISHASNSALEVATGEWLALLDHDDILRPHALFEVAKVIGERPQSELVYSDEDKIGADGERYDPFFKPDFSYEMLRGMNYFNHLTVHRTRNIRDVGGWRPGYEGSQDYDLNLRIVERVPPQAIVHIPKVLYHWRAVAGSTASAGSEKDYAWNAGLRALEDHAERTGFSGTVDGIEGLPFYRLRPKAPEPEPLVSLIIPTRDRFELVRDCIRSIQERTTYRNFEIIIVDNESNERESLDYFNSVDGKDNVRVLRYEGAFNYSAINNFAVRAARGSVVGLVNNDILVISPEWLSEMVGWACQEDIGCVGAKLYYENDTVQHAGVILGVGGVAGHSHKHQSRDEPGYFSRLGVVSNMSAVTAACLVVRKSVYEEVGGLNEQDLKVAFNDVDFCLRVREAGYRNLYTPFAELYHLESISRGQEDNPEKIARFNQEIAYMEERWGPALTSDPFYSPNLTLQEENFAIAFPPRVEMSSST